MAIQYVRRTLSLIGYGLSTPLMVYLLYALITNLRKKQAIPTNENIDIDITASKKGDKTIFRVSLIALTLFTLSSVIFLALYITIFAVDGSNNLDIYVQWVGFGWILYAIGIWIMLLTFLLRVDYAFKDSFLAYPPCIIRFLYGLLVIFALLIIAIIITFASEHDTLYEHMGNYLVPLAIIDQVLFNVILLYLLFRKLFVILVKRGTQQMTAESALNVDNPKDTSTNVIQLDTLETTTRYSTLVLMGICSTLIFSIFVGISVFNDHLPTGFFWAIDTIVNAIALFLMFSVNQELYSKLCSRYHVCFSSCCINCSYGTFRNENENTEKTKEEYATLALL
eukprot:44473_1